MINLNNTEEFLKLFNQLTPEEQRMLLLQWEVTSNIRKSTKNMKENRKKIINDITETLQDIEMDKLILLSQVVKEMSRG